MNPTGLCKCGCGMKTKIAGWNETRRGYVKGQPKDYIYGHHVAMALSKRRKLGAYKRGATVKSQNAADRIEQAMRRSDG
jgi:hypothetical protein